MHFYEIIKKVVETLVCFGAKVNPLLSLMYGESVSIFFKEDGCLYIEAVFDTEFEATERMLCSFEGGDIDAAEVISCVAKVISSEKSGWLMHEPYRCTYSYEDKYVVRERAVSDNYSMTDLVFRRKFEYATVPYPYTTEPVLRLVQSYKC